MFYKLKLKFVSLHSKFDRTMFNLTGCNLYFCYLSTLCISLCSQTTTGLLAWLQYKFWTWSVRFWECLCREQSFETNKQTNLTSSLPDCLIAIQLSCELDIASNVLDMSSLSCVPSIDSNEYTISTCGLTKDKLNMQIRYIISIFYAKNIPKYQRVYVQYDNTSHQYVQYEH